MKDFAYPSDRTILVTGAAGFLGSHLCKKLLAENGNVEVLGIDNLYSGTKFNITELKDHPRFEFTRHDVTRPFYVEVDEIYNLACPASPVHYQYDPVQTLKTSVHGAINMLGLAKRTKSKILQASTSEVYGDPKISPQHEEYWGNVNPIGIRSCYDEGKRCAETMFFDYKRQHALDTRVIRIFNTYGPHMHPNDGRVVSNFIIQALKNEPITIYGDGSQTRSFCYVDDLLNGMVGIMDSVEAGSAGPINIGNPHEITVKQLAEIILELTASRSKIDYLQLPGDDPLQRCPDISKVQELIGWKPRVELRTGLAKTIKYFDELLMANPKVMEAAE